jgi:hypothetical protein
MPSHEYDGYTPEEKADASRSVQELLEDFGVSDPEPLSPPGQDSPPVQDGKRPLARKIRDFLSQPESHC